MYSAKDIPIGAENAISRADLARKWNCSDRVARQRISRMRCEEDNSTFRMIRQARRVLKRIEMQQMHGEGLAG